MNKPSSLYIHIPFCNSICTYCDFAKLLYRKEFVDLYLISLKKEIESYQIPHNLKTVYVGGGTPTSLDDEQFSFLLSLIDDYVGDVEEYTFEANPESLSVSKLEMMKKHHVNRLSIGVESTNDKILKSINRLHTWEDVKRAYLEARRIGFDNISFDLIIGLPNVSDEMLINDINNIIELNPEHISCYSLTIHPQTVMGIKGYKELSDDEIRRKYDLINEILMKHGYTHYEISNWAKVNKVSKHNYVYWKCEHYYGVGLNASGYIDNIRYENTKNLSDYIKGKYVLIKEEVDPNDDFEYLMLNLITSRGIVFEEYKNLFGMSFMDKYQKRIKDNKLDNYFVFDDYHIYLTYEGMMVLDAILLDLTV